MTINYISLAKTHIFNTLLTFQGKSEKVYYHKYKPEIAVDFTEDNISFYAFHTLTNKKKKEAFLSIEYKDIKNVTLSLCRRNYGTTMSIPIIMNEYHIDFIIYLNNGESYYLESQSWSYFTQIVDLLTDKNIKVIDQLNIYKNYLQDNQKYIKQLDKVFDALATQYQLQHYRGNNERNNN